MIDIERKRERLRKQAAKHRILNPEKVAARRAVYNSLRRREMVRGVCFCGETKVDAHHDDYSKPLEVRWLCRKHHREIHPGDITHVGGFKMIRVFVPKYDVDNKSISEYTSSEVEELISNTQRYATLNMSEENKTLEILWTVKQVAVYLGVGTGTVYQWISEKRHFDPAKIVRFSNRVRIPRSEVERLAGIVRGQLQASV